MKRLWIVVAMAAIALPAAAQKGNARFEMEADPIAYALKGYSLHGIYVKNRVRTDLGVFGIEQPEGYSGNKGFQIHSRGAGMKLNYLLDQKEHWFAGIGFGYARHSIRYKETGESKTQNGASVGVHIGYRWFMFNKSETGWKNLYLAPWVSVDYNKTLNDVSFTGASYKQNSFSLFPTVHLGYKFMK